jgi:hypothetical protein
VYSKKKKLEHAVKTFAVSFPPFGISLVPEGTNFSYFWQEFCLVLAGVLVPSTKIFRAQFKSLLHFLEDEGV